jgi:hypothetical protein
MEGTPLHRAERTSSAAADHFEPLLTKARRRSEQEGLTQARFERGDATNTG